MITIKKDEDKTQARQFLKSLGHLPPADNEIVMTARDGDKILAAGSLSLQDGRVFLNCAVLSKDMEEDLNLLLGLMKGLLNLADLRGIKTVYGTNPALFDIYKILRFQKKSSCGKTLYKLPLEGYFTCENH